MVIRPAAPPKSSGRMAGESHSRASAPRAATRHTRMAKWQQHATNRYCPHLPKAVSSRSCSRTQRAPASTPNCRIAARTQPPSPPLPPPPPPPQEVRCRPLFFKAFPLAPCLSMTLSAGREVALCLHYFDFRKRWYYTHDQDTLIKCRK